MSTTTETASTTPARGRTQLQTRTQRILGELDRLIGPASKHLELLQSLAQGRKLQQLQGLVQRHGLLQTVLFLRRKSAAEGSNPNELPPLSALVLISTVLRTLWKEEKSQDGQGLAPALFLAGKDSEFFILLPEALARLDLVTYQRLQLDALEVAGLASRLAEAWAELDKGLDGRQPNGGNKHGRP